LRPGVDRPREQDQFWYLRYQDRQGKPCQAKLTLRQVLKKLREGKFSPQIEAARSSQGTFEPLASYDEFRGVLKSLPAPKAAKSRQTPAAAPEATAHLGWWIALGSGIGIVLLLIGTLFLLVRG
jgi:hypothetical protein